MQFAPSPSHLYCTVMEIGKPTSLRKGFCLQLHVQYSHLFFASVSVVKSSHPLYSTWCPLIFATKRVHVYMTMVILQYLIWYFEIHPSNKIAVHSQISEYAHMAVVVKYKLICYSIFVCVHILYFVEWIYVIFNCKSRIAQFLFLSPHTHIPAPTHTNLSTPLVCTHKINWLCMY